jgi:guanylate kinase
MKKGKFIIISGPSGVGKGTIYNVLLKELNAWYSVSMTTRDIREGEVDGVNYYFISKDEFRKRIDEGKLLEYNIYNDNYYGTPKDKVLEKLNNGINVILEIEVEGAMQVKSVFPEAVTIMLTPPDSKTLENRLRGRGTETEESVINRLNKAKIEITYLPRYDYSVINEDGGVEKCAELIYSIMQAEHARTVHTSHIIKEFE